ncbi:hypothetical protein FKM82_030042 [Ascaphus truei]
MAWCSCVMVTGHLVFFVVCPSHEILVNDLAAYQRRCWKIYIYLYMYVCVCIANGNITVYSFACLRQICNPAFHHYHPAYSTFTAARDSGK